MSSDYGTYRLSYTPPEPDSWEEYPPISIKMSIPGDANVDQMLRFFEAFLAASGYVLKGELQVVEPEHGCNPWGHITVKGPQNTDFVPFSMADDILSFGGK